MEKENAMVGAGTHIVEALYWAQVDCASARKVTIKERCMVATV